MAVNTQQLIKDHEKLRCEYIVLRLVIKEIASMTSNMHDRTQTETAVYRIANEAYRKSLLEL